MINQYLPNPLYLDTLATASLTVFCGLYWGLAGALASHGIGALVLLEGLAYLPFVAVHLASVCLVHYFHVSGRFRTVVDAVSLLILMALLSASLGSLVSHLFFDGYTLHPIEYLVTGFLSIGMGDLQAGFWARLPINMIDKGIGVLLAFLLHRRFSGSVNP